MCDIHEAKHRGTSKALNNFSIYNKRHNEQLSLPQIRQVCVCVCVCVSHFSHIPLFVTLWTVAC